MLFREYNILKKYGDQLVVVVLKTSGSGERGFCAKDFMNDNDRSIDRTYLDLRGDDLTQETYETEEEVSEKFCCM